MIKTGLLNPQINSLLSRIRHTNTVVIADRGFTTKGKMLYAIALGWTAENQLTIRPLAKTENPDVNHIKRVELLGYQGRLSFTQTTDGLVVQLPDKKISDLTCPLKITASNLKPA
jgi:hypothetical protein